MINKKTNRKGFTIVELVIVIAVIAVLAAVLVPTFGNVISDSKITAAKQEAKIIYSEYVAGFNYESDETVLDDVVILIDDKYYVTIVDGAVTDCFTEAPTGEYTLLTKSGDTFTTSGVTTSTTNSNP